MAFGPGKYDEVCTQVRETTQAQGVMLVIFDGNLGTGFSVQGSLEMTLMLPNILEQIAKEIRNTE